MTCKRALIGVVLAVVVLSTPPMFGQEMILVPLAFKTGVEVAGANGTRWRGEVWFANATNQDAFIQSIANCGPVFCGNGGSPYPAGFIGKPDNALDTLSDPGVVLSPRSFGQGTMVISSRIFEITRHAQPQGIAVPVVHEAEFLSGESWLLGVPSTSAVRAALRVYDPYGFGGGRTVTVAFLDDKQTVLATATLTTVRRIVGPTSLPADFYRPGFVAVYDLASTFPALASVDYYHVRLRADADVKYWAMVSVTDNGTQQVLLITP